MSKKNDFQYKWHILIAICGVIIVFIWIGFLLKKITPIEQKITQTEDLIPGSTSFITPKIVQVKSGLFFEHPQKHFSFEYSNKWHLDLTRRNVSEPFYNIILNNNPLYDNARVHFMNDYRGLPYFETETIENKSINNIETKWRTMYKNNQPFEISIMFTQNTFNNNLFGLYIYLPQENQQEFIQQVEDIIASLK